MEKTLIMVDNGNYHVPATDNCVDLTQYFFGGYPSSSSSYLTKYCIGNVFRELRQIENKCLNIVDSNSAHQLSYFLAEKAYQDAKIKEKMLVINIDNHFDYGNAGSQNRSNCFCREINCGNWGNFLSPKIDYVAVGVSLLTEDKARKGAQCITSKNIHENDISVLLQLIESTSYFYISVDMDCLVGNGRTNWDDCGTYDIVWLKGSLNEISRLMAGKQLLGADIVGMPPKKNSPTKQSVVNNFLSDVNDVSELLLGMLKK